MPIIEGFFVFVRASVKRNCPSITNFNPFSGRCRSSDDPDVFEEALAKTDDLYIRHQLRAVLDSSLRWFATPEKFQE